MMNGIYGITIAVKDLEKAAAKYEAFLGIQAEFSIGCETRFIAGLEDIAYDYEAESVLFKLPGMRINLISTTDERSPIGKFLKKKGEGLFMVSMEVDNVEKESQRLKSNDVRLVFDKSATGSFGETNFIHPKSLNGVQFEIFRPTGMFKV